MYQMKQQPWWKKHQIYGEMRKNAIVTLKQEMVNILGIVTWKLGILGMTMKSSPVLHKDG